METTLTKNEIISKLNDLLKLRETNKTEKEKERENDDKLNLILSSDYSEVFAYKNHQLEKSKKILDSLNNYKSSLGRKCSEDYSKEEIGFCTKCNKMIAMKWTHCDYCKKNFCKNHREAHQCDAANKQTCFKSRLCDGKNAFLNKLKANKIKAGVK